MALVKPVIFQVVGYQNSGKTTFLIKLVQALTSYGLKTVTIKHHGHGGKPELAREKDSTRHTEAGAFAAIVEGDGRLILQAEQKEWSLEEQIQLMEPLHPDVILIEGHKQKSYPKLLMLRDSKDLSLLSELRNIKAIIYWEKALKENLDEKLKVPSFHIGDESAFIQISHSLNMLVRKSDLDLESK